jgi:hypothetical protein
MTLSQLKSELQEKEKDLINIRLFNKGDYEIIKDTRDMILNLALELGKDKSLTQILEKLREAEISCLKKGISACEEILNSQQNKTASELNPLRQDQLQTGFADTYSQDNKNINSDSNLVVNSDEEPISEGSVRNADFIMDKNLDPHFIIAEGFKLTKQNGKTNKRIL